MLYEINSYVMYCRIGVCQITAIKDGKFVDRPKVKYYILHPIYSHDLVIMSPLEKLKTHVRPLASKQEVISLIESMPQLEPVWEDDAKMRQSAFMAALDSGRCEEWMALINSITHKSDEFNLYGRTLSLNDKTVLKEAKRLLFEEFAYSLNLDPDRVESYINKMISEKNIA